MSNPDKFDPQGAARPPKASSSKRVALILFMCAGLLMIVVTYAIMNSGAYSMRSAEPKRFEAATGNADSLEQMSRYIERPEIPQPELEPEPFAEPVIETPPPKVVYITRPSSSISERKKELHNSRMLAAAAKSEISGFNSEYGARPAYADAGASPLQREKAAAEAELAAAYQLEAQSYSATGGAMPIIAQEPQGSRNSDPNGWDAKDRFVRETGKLAEGYSQHHRTSQLTGLEIKAGTIIPCVLISGINSDLPGNSLGQVTEDVYDSATGEYLLIPKGSKVVGTYDNRISYGQSRVLVIWSKLVYPDGSTLMLENLSAADQSGYTGVKGKVNRHWNSIVTSALIVSLLGAGADMVMDDGNSNNRDSPKSVLAENAARSVADAMSKIIEREADRAPTIKIRPGGRFLLFVRQDMIFASPWK